MAIEVKLKNKLRELMNAKAEKIKRRVGYITVAKNTGISKNNLVHMIENPDADVRTSTALKLQHYFECSFDDLFDYEITVMQEPEAAGV